MTVRFEDLPFECCPEAVEWVDGQDTTDMAHLWERCDRADWLVYAADCWGALGSKDDRALEPIMLTGWVWALHSLCGLDSDRLARIASIDDICELLEAVLFGPAAPPERVRRCATSLYINSWRGCGGVVGLIDLGIAIPDFMPSWLADAVREVVPNPFLGELS